MVDVGAAELENKRRSVGVEGRELTGELRGEPVGLDGKILL